eukprot:UN27455
MSAQEKLLNETTTESFFGTTDDIETQSENEVEINEEKSVFDVIQEMESNPDSECKEEHEENSINKKDPVQKKKSSARAKRKKRTYTMNDANEDYVSDEEIKDFDAPETIREINQQVKILGEHSLTGESFGRFHKARAEKAEEALRELAHKFETQNDELRKVKLENNKFQKENQKLLRKQTKFEERISNQSKKIDEH